MRERSDEELVLAARGGEVEGFVVLCERYYRGLVAIARAELGDGHLAEDAAQEALAQACRRLDSLADPRRFGGWLATICRNKARDLRRRQRPVEPLGDRDVAAGGDTEDPAVEAVSEAMEKMAPEMRELLYLRYRSGLSYRAIGELLGLSSEAVHGRLRRAKAELKDRLERLQDRSSS